MFARAGGANQSFPLISPPAKSAIDGNGLIGDPFSDEVMEDDVSERNKSRMMADIDGEFLVFIIELKVHKLWQVWPWYPVVNAMTRMLVELLENREFGLLNYEYRFSFRNQLIIMYWRSYEHMHDWALNREAKHVEGRRMLTKLMKDDPDLVGFWHESYASLNTNRSITTYPLSGSARPAPLPL